MGGGTATQVLFLVLHRAYDCAPSSAHLDVAQECSHFLAGHAGVRWVAGGERRVGSGFVRRVVGGRLASDPKLTLYYWHN